jgi:AhpD family alkylhydroperoxidase
MATKYPPHYQEIKKNYPDLFQAYEKLGEVANKGPLNRKMAHLIKLAASAAIKSEGAVHSHTRRALNAGVKPAEIRHAIILLVNTIGFPGMMAALSWVNDILDEKK